MNTSVLLLPLLSGCTVISVFLWAGRNQKINEILEDRLSVWKKEGEALKLPFLEKIPAVQFFAGFATVLVSPFYPSALLLLLLIAVLPHFLLNAAKNRNKKQLEAQLDTMLSALSNAIAVTGNLQYAIEDIAEGEPAPMGDELKKVLGEVQLGRNIEDALLRFAKRSRLTQLQSAVTQIIVGKKTGGDLKKILAGTAAGLREMNRLEGVVKTQTAEGKGQAWVIGLTPPALVVILQLINPGWLLPMWSTAAGWLLLALCATLEAVAILLIRKILSVDI